MNIDSNLIVSLRQKSGAGFADCKEALVATNGSLEEAVIYLRKKGLLDIKERSNKSTNEGTIGHYIHTGSKIGVLVEINSETDFVARSEPFQSLAKDLAIHIAAINPKWISAEDVPEDVLKVERDIALSSVDKNKPAAILEKIASGKLQKFYKENCLLEQPFVKDQTLLIKDLLGALVSKVGEKVVVKRFIRYDVG